MRSNSSSQIEISYIGDLVYSVPKDVFLVENDMDYIQFCNELSEGLTLKDSLRVWVRSKNHFVWLQDFARQIDCPCNFEEKTARLVLAEQWNVQIPEWLEDADVIENGLLEIQVDHENQTSFTNRFLAHFLGNVFYSEVLVKENIVNVIKALVKNEAKAVFKQYPLMEICLEAKCREWASASKEIWIKELCEQIPKHTHEVWHWLSFWSILSGYPEKLLEYVLSPQQVLFVKKIPVEAVCDLPLEPKAREEILTQIKLFFDEIKDEVTSSEEFQKIVAVTSGRLSQEYHFVVSFLRYNLFPVTVDDVQKVQAKFRSCPGVITSQLDTLDRYVMPRRPTLLEADKEWDSRKWVKWAVEEYMPYRTWQVYNGYYDEDLEQTVIRFTDWYISEYISVQKDPNLSLVHCLGNLASDDSKDDLSIVLLIDCFPVNFFYLLDNALRNVGFKRHDLGYRFAALPSSTEYNKPLLLSGEWQNSDKAYDAILKSRASSDWDGKRVVYLSNLREMSEMEVRSEPTIAILNFVDSDKLLHSDVEANNTSYEEELHRLFTRIAETVSKLKELWSGSSENFSVYVITDHGACSILEKEKTSFDSDVVNKLFPDERYRFSIINEDQIGSIPSNLWAFGYQFRRPFISEDKIFFLPKGHNTVRQPSKGKGYLHGGVTPEEVIVPSALYKLVKAAWKAPKIRFLNLNLVKGTGKAKFYIQRVVSLQIEIQNPNPISIRILRASVLSPETDLKGCETPIIQAEGVAVLRMNCYFKRAALGKKHLEIEIVYEIAGDTYTMPIELETEFKSAMSGGFSLKDL